MGSFSGLVLLFLSHTQLVDVRYTIKWPEEALIPGFRATYNSYMTQVSKLSMDLIVLLGESLGMEPSALLSFYDEPELMQHRSKVLHCRA